MILHYRLKNTTTTEQYPHIASEEFSLTSDEGYRYKSWSSPRGLHSKEYAPRLATEEETANLGGGSLLRPLLPGGSFTEVKVFEVPEEAVPAKVEIVGLPKAISLASAPKRVMLPKPSASSTQVEALVARTIHKCQSSIEHAYGAATYVFYEASWLGQDRWLVKPDWQTGNMTYGTWKVDSQSGTVSPSDAAAKSTLAAIASGGCGLPKGISPVRLGTPEWWEAVAPKRDYMWGGLWRQQRRSPSNATAQEGYTEDKYQLYAAVFVGWQRAIVGVEPREDHFQPFVESNAPDQLGGTAHIVLKEILRRITSYRPHDPATAWMRPYIAPETEAEMSIPYRLFVTTCLEGFSPGIPVEQCRNISLNDFWPIYQAQLPRQR